jgi:hypothetical protein
VTFSYDGGMPKRLPDTPTLADMSDFRRAVEEAPGGVVTALGWEVRLASGESRLKDVARSRAAEAFDEEGMVVIPEVPGDQKATVFVARKSSPVGRLWALLSKPSEKALEPLLRAAGEAGEATAERQALTELREVLAEAQALAARAAGDGDGAV